MKVAVLTVLYFYLPVSHYLNFWMNPIVASFLTSLSTTDVQIVRKDQYDGNGDDRHQCERESDDESLNHASSAVEGAPLLFLFLDDIFQSVNDQFVKLDGGVVLAAPLLGAEILVV